MTKKSPQVSVAKSAHSGHVFKQVILANVAKHWIYAYLYAKKDRKNITQEELAGFKKLAKDYASTGEDKIAALLRDEELQEICHED